MTARASDDRPILVTGATVDADLLADPDALREVLREHLLDQTVLAADLPADGTVDDRRVVHVIGGLLLEE